VDDALELLRQYSELHRLSRPKYLLCTLSGLSTVVFDSCVYIYVCVCVGKAVRDALVNVGDDGIVVSRVCICSSHAYFRCHV